MTPEQLAARVLEGVPRFNIKVGEHTDPSVVMLETDALAAIAHHLAPGDDLVAQATAADLDGLLNAARELAQYASYAEIVGGISVNRPQVREWCDAVFAAIKTMPEDEGFEPVAPNITALLARISALTATVERRGRMHKSLSKRFAEANSARKAAEVEVSRLRDRLARMEGATRALGVLPDGYCFCSKNRVGNSSKEHEPECADIRALISGSQDD